MADEADLAQELEERERAAGLAAVLRHAPSPLIQPPDERDCTGCSDPIPRARLVARPSARYCTDCQSSIDMVSARLARA